MNGSLPQRSKTLELKIIDHLQSKFRFERMDRLVPVLTELGGAKNVIACSLLLSLIQRDHGRALLILVISHLVVHLLKKSLGRARPYVTFQGEIELRSERMRDHSFPSGHTAAAFTLAMQVIAVYPILSALVLPVALFVGWSRIYLGLHYPSDVGAGMVIGIVVPYLLL